MAEKNENKIKKGGKFKAFLRAVFVNNIDLKLFAIVFAVVITLLVAGLGGKQDKISEPVIENPPQTSQQTIK